MNQRIANAEHDWKSLLQSYRINLVVVRPEMPLSAVLKLTPGTNVLFDDGKVIVFDTNGLIRQVSGETRSVTRTARLFLDPPAHQKCLAFDPITKTQKGENS